MTEERRQQKREAQARYRQTDKGKAVQKRYAESEGGKATITKNKELRGPEIVIYDRNRALKRQCWDLERFTIFNYAQSGMCYTCGQTNFEVGLNKPLFADHDHETEQPRALLCHFCNLALGCVRDDPDLLERLISYLGVNNGNT